MIQTGTILQNRYLVREKIGAGGMGAVFVATDQRFNSQVAIKETFFSEAALRRAFEREAQLLNSLRHPALPRVSDHFEEADGQFLVMEYIAGEDLSEILERQGGAFAVADVLLWADQLLDALDYLHSQKMPIVHRDIKPQNLKLTPRGQIVLLDFGLAKGSITDVSKLTQTKSVFGYSRAYAPLEQIQGTGTDPRSDLYSLAATVYHLFTGSAPVDALTRAMAVLNGGEDSLRPANELNPKVPASVSAVLHQAMSLNPALRPQTASLMRRSLAEAAENPESFAADFVENAKTTAGALFTQKTELMGAKDGNQTAANANLTTPLEADLPFESVDSEATKFSRTNLEKQQFATKLQSPAPITDLEESEAEKRNVAFNVPVEASAAKDLNSKEVPQKRRSPLKAIGIATAILILAGGGFAGWFAMSDSNSDLKDQKTAPAENVLKNETQKTEAGETKQNSNSTASAPVSSESQTVLRTNPAPKNQINPVPQTEVKPNTQTIIVERADKLQTKSSPENVPETKTQVTGTGRGGVVIVPEIRIPEIRVDDVPGMSAEEREELRRAREELRKEMHQLKNEELQRRVREGINRKRAQQGLPPLSEPPPPPEKRNPPKPQH